MRAVPIVLIVSVMLGGCAAPKPVNVVAGEACERCKRPITQERLAGEHVATNGFAVKFRTIHCMSTWIAQHPAAANDWFFVSNYAKGGWVKAHRASFVRIVVNRNTMEQDFIAFADPALAAEAAREHGTTVVSWTDVLALGRTEPMGGD